jgi:pimeloyl-ACP methyl ester carboxylesterase
MYRDALGTICARLGLDRVVLVGHSLGGQIALACAAAWPERIAGLVMIASGAAITVSSELSYVLEHDFARFPAFMERAAWSPATPAELRALYSGVMLTDQAVMIADFRAVDVWDARPLLQRIQAPTLVIAGADDRLTPVAHSDELTSGIAGSKKVVLPRAGHMLMLEQTAAFLDALAAFIDPIP